MKCQVQWVDANGRPTPDNNDAVAVAHFHKVARVDGHFTEYLPEVAQSFHVCAAHMERVRYNWHYGSGGGWEFAALDEVR